MQTPPCCRGRCPNTRPFSARVPRLDAVFVPGGDPGHTAPSVLMHVLEKEAEVLRKYHPRAQMWVSTQGFDKSWLDEFYAISPASRNG